ncbi:MAG: hypothetical protein ACTSRA_07150 [Promethearchaeota archaeon]
MSRPGGRPECREPGKPGYPGKRIRKSPGARVPDQPSRFILITAIIDISGRMSGGKIEAVKHSLVQTIRDWQANSAALSFVLITFHSIVDIYFSTQEQALSLGDPDSVLHSEDRIKDILASRLSQLSFGPSRKRRIRG